MKLLSFVSTHDFRSCSSHSLHFSFQESVRTAADQACKTLSKVSSECCLSVRGRGGGVVAGSRHWECWQKEGWVQMSG